MTSTAAASLPVDGHQHQGDVHAIPPLGEESFFPLTTATGNIYTVRHGSSLALMSQVCEFLANPIQDDSFNYVDPTADHHKWNRRGMTLYYAAVVDPSSGNLLCALRAATEGMMMDQNNNQDNNQDKDNHHDNHHHEETNDESSSTTKKRKLSSEILPSRKRLLIDYVYTALESRDKGIAGLLVRQIIEVAQNNSATSYVLSIEDSCVYWMEKHQFFLCSSPALNKLLNLFPDTHLLKRRQEKETTTNNDNDEDSDEEEAQQRVHLQGLSISSSSDDSESSTGSSTSTTTPPEAYSLALAKLLGQERSEGMKVCLHSLSVLISNAAEADSSEDRKKCKIRINNPQVHKRVFAVGGDAAMELLQACGFQLEVDDQGNAILHFHAASLGRGSSWLTVAVSRLEQEAAAN